MDPHFLEQLRAVNQYLGLAAFGCVFYIVVVAIGWGTIVQKRLLVVLALGPLIGAYGSNRASVNHLPATSAVLLYALWNTVIIAVALTIRPGKVPPMEQKPDQHADTSDTPLDEGAKSGPMGSSTKRDGGIIPTANPPEVEGDPFQAPGQPDQADAAGMLEEDVPLTALDADASDLDGSPDREADGEEPNPSPPAPGPDGRQDVTPDAAK